MQNIKKYCHLKIIWKGDIKIKKGDIKIKKGDIKIKSMILIFDFVIYKGYI
jgi:hypothetical protein